LRQGLAGLVEQMAPRGINRQPDLVVGSVASLPSICTVIGSLP